MNSIKNNLVVDLAKQAGGASTASSRWDMIKKLFLGPGARSGSPLSGKEMMMKKLLGGDGEIPFNKSPVISPFLREMLRNKIGGSGMVGGKYGPPAFVKEMIRNKLSRYGMPNMFGMSEDRSDNPLNFMEEMMERRFGGFGMSRDQLEIPPYVREMIMRNMMSRRFDTYQDRSFGPPDFVKNMLARKFGGFGMSRDQPEIPPFVREMLMRKMIRGDGNFGMPYGGQWKRPSIPPFMNMMRMPYPSGQGFRMPFNNDLQFLQRMAMDKIGKSLSDKIGM